jgi:hypothetical protein
LAMISELVTFYKTVSYIPGQFGPLLIPLDDTSLGRKLSVLRPGRQKGNGACHFDKNRSLRGDVFVSE